MTLKHNKHYKNVETYPCKNCGSLFQRRLKPRKGKRTQPGIRQKGSVTCSRDCARAYSGLMNSSKKRQKKEEEHAEKLKKLRKMGIVPKTTQKV